MNYDNYTKAIVRAWGWGLDGWPSGVPFKRMSKQSTISHVRAIYDALKAGTCKWIKLATKEKQDEHIQDFEENVVQGEVVEKVRKTRKDKGGSHVVRNPRKSRTSKKDGSGADSGEDGEEEDGQASGMEDEPASSKSKVSKSAKSSKSAQSSKSANVSVEEKRKALERLSGLRSKSSKTAAPVKSKRKCSRDDDEEVEKPPRKRQKKIEEGSGKRKRSDKVGKDDGKALKRLKKRIEKGAQPAQPSDRSPTPPPRPKPRPIFKGRKGCPPGVRAPIS
jgi:hypothetical protein